MNVVSGAVDLKECPNKPGRCACGVVCGICGYRKHMAIHAPPLGGRPGGKPYGHAYEPKRGTRHGSSTHQP